MGRGSVVLVGRPSGGCGRSGPACVSRGPDGRGGDDVLDGIAVPLLACGRVQAPEHEGCVGPEDVLMDVGPVGDSDSEVGQEPGLCCTASCSDEPCVDLAGGYEGDGGPLKELLPSAHWRVPSDLLDGRGVHVGCVCCLLPAGELVVGQGLGGVEDHGGSPG